jgi:hypothetical protein
MTHIDIIRMAREAKLDQLWGDDPLSDWSVELTRFAALVAAAEREACAQVCEEIPLDANPIALTHLPTIERCVAAIRARGEE